MNCQSDNQQTERIMPNMSELQFHDLFDLAEIQRIQDAFSLATGVAALITDRAGNPITRPSQFTRFCEMIRSTTKGRTHCRQSDAYLGLLNPAGPVWGLCLSGKLLDGGAGIAVGDRQIANWLIGQVLDEPVDEAYYRQYARELGLDETEFLQALTEVPRMSRQRFEQICQALHLIAAQLSRLALRNAEQRQVIEQYRQTQAALQESEERYRALVQKSSEAIVLIDPETRMVIESNRHFQELIGYSQTELAEMPVYKFVLGNKEQIDRYYEEVLPLQHELPVESRQFRHKSGRVVEVERSGALVHLRGKTVYMVTARDVTERIEQEKAATKQA